MQKIVPHLWFDKEAREAAEFYIQIFPDSKITASATLPDTPGGDTDLVAFNLSGHDFMAISAGPTFKINASISFMVNFDPSRDDRARDHIDLMWEKLSDGGEVLMPLDEYPFSKRYGWIKDRFGVSWQLILTNPDGEPRPFIVPSFLFAGDVVNRAEEAINFYVSVFEDSKIGIKAPYTEDTGPAKKGALMFADFMLENQWFAAMDSGVDHPFPFSEAVSLLINCDTQEDIDYYWDKLSSVPEAEQCGWLKDKFGVSWQVSPAAMSEMMAKGSPEQMARITKAFLPMKKINIDEIEAAYSGQ